MQWSLSIGRIYGTTIRVHVTFLLLLIWIFVGGYMVGGAAVAWNELGFVVLLFFFVLVHEFGHIFVARAFGILTPDVTLLPIGGVARLERIPEVPHQEFLIAIAGPAVNIVIAAVLILLGPGSFNIQIGALENSEASMIERLATFNLLIAAFNIIPAFPMDGGRVLRAALTARFGFERATTIAATVGQWVAFLFGFLGLFFSPMLIFIAIFVYLAATTEAQSVILHTFLRKVPVSAAMMTQFTTLSGSAPLSDAADALLRTSQNEFPVIDKEKKLAGILVRNGLIDGLKRHGPQARISEAMAVNVPAVGPQCLLEDAWRLMQESSVPAVGVVNSNKQLVGLVTAEAIGEVVLLSKLAPKQYPIKAVTSNDGLPLELKSPPEND